MPIDTIEHSGDPRLAGYRNVPDPVLLRDHGAFVAEGRLVVRTLLMGSRFEAESVLVTPPALDSLADVLDARPGLQVFVADLAILSAIVGFNIHRGCLALGRRPVPLSVAQALAGAGGAPLIVMTERVGNADNMGAIFRSAAAFGAGCVLLSPDCCDPLYRKAIRVSIGASLRLPFAVVPDWPGGLAQVKEAGYAIVALTPQRTAEELTAYAGSRPPRLALLLGHEGDGVSEAALRIADHHVRIGMAAGVDSVNVAAAAAIALYICAGPLRMPGVMPAEGLVDRPGRG